MGTKILSASSGRIRRTTAPLSVDDRINQLRRELGLNPRQESKAAEFRMNLRALSNPVLNRQFFTA